jgi:hypothetical protein
VFVDSESFRILVEVTRFAEGFEELKRIGRKRLIDSRLKAAEIVAIPRFCTLIGQYILQPLLLTLLLLGLGE